MRAIPQLLIDMDTGEILFQKDAGKRWHPASLTKLMTAYVVFEAIEANELDLETPISIPRFATRVTPSKSGLPADTAIRTEDALLLLLVKSANDVALAIGHHFDEQGDDFVGRMNKAAQRLGMTQTRFINPNGLHHKDQYSTARDMAILSLALWSRYSDTYGDLFRTRTLAMGQQRLRSFNVLLNRFRGSTGLKTGFICESGYNLVGTAKRGGRDLMVVVMGGVSPRERNQLSASLLKQGFDNKFAANGNLLTSIANLSQAPANMRTRVCGPDKPNYQAQRIKRFPAGTKGAVSYLEPAFEARHQDITPLGRFRRVAMPPLMAALDWGDGPAANIDVETETASVILPPLRPEN